MVTVLGAAFVSPVILAAAALAASFTVAGAGANGSTLFFLIMLAPLCSAVASALLWRWCFGTSSGDSGSKGSSASVSLLCGVAVLGVELHSGAFLDALRHLAQEQSSMPYQIAFSALIELSVASMLTVSAVMLAVLSVEVPLRILLSSIASYEPGGALIAARCMLTVWLLFAGISLISDSFSERFARIISSFVG
jgi:hypothetical protein